MSAEQQLVEDYLASSTFDDDPNNDLGHLLAQTDAETTGDLLLHHVTDTSPLTRRAIALVLREYHVLENHVLEAAIDAMIVMATHDVDVVTRGFAVLFLLEHQEHETKSADVLKALVDFKKDVFKNNWSKVLLDEVGNSDLEDFLSI